MCNLAYIKEFKQLIEFKKETSENLKYVITLERETEQLLEKINKHIRENFKLSDFNLQDWIEYRIFILNTLQNIRADINYYSWKLKTIKNSLDYIPIG